MPDWIKRIGLLNLLLVFAPLAIAMEWTHSDPTWIFFCSCIAIIPLAGLMGKATEVLAEHLGPGIGGLLNASFGNAAELIIAFFALKAGMHDVVKASITGSILGNILLVMGASLLAGGLKFREQKFNRTASGLAATMLALAMIGLLMPAIFHAHLVQHHTTANEAGVSLEIAIVLFVSYALMLLFSLKTHKHLYNSEEAQQQHRDSLKEPEFHWSIRTATIVLLSATIAVAWMSELLVGSIEATRQSLGWTEVFVGVIVVAIVGNAAEHSTAILVAMKNRMDLSLQISLGSALQIALFVAPVLVFTSYLPGFERLDLVFTMMEVVAVAVSVLVVALVAIDGESNWMEGLLLLAVYLILAIAFYHLPAESAAAIQNP